jgi:anthranilate phosphoribosyltransferase
VDFGLGRIDNDDLKVASVAGSADKVRGVLDGESGPARDVVLANAAGALLAADKVATLKDGVAIAASSIDTGQARARLDALAKLSQSLT